MLERASAAALRWARVSPEPKPPIGAPGSVRTFRAGRNYYYIRLLRWGATQIGAAIGLVFSVGFVAGLVEGVNRVAPRRPPIAASPSPTVSPIPEATIAADPSEGATAAIEASPSPSPSRSPTTSGRDRGRRSGDEAWTRITSRVVSRIPPQGMAFFRSWVVPFLLLLEVFAIATFLLSVPLTYALVRLEFEQHWYIVTDRSLRIRTGVFSLSESTMSFANLQQVEVKQGPLQRFLGLADVRVRSAGGGSSSEDEEGEPLHTGVFQSVESAEEIRDLIVARLRAFREAGLGDPDPAKPTTTGNSAGGASAETLEAAREVLRQTRALREATTPRA